MNGVLCLHHCLSAARGRAAPCCMHIACGVGEPGQGWVAQGLSLSFVSVTKYQNERKMKKCFVCITAQLNLVCMPHACIACTATCTTSRTHDCQGAGMYAHMLQQPGSRQACVHRMWCKNTETHSHGHTHTHACAYPHPQSPPSFHTPPPGTHLCRAPRGHQLRVRLVVGHAGLRVGGLGRAVQPLRAAAACGAARQVYIRVR